MLIPIVVKHSGKVYNVDVDLAAGGGALRKQLSELTGVPDDRQKLLTRGAQIRNDTDLSALNVGPKQAFMLLGSATPLPKEPVNVDMVDHESTSAPEFAAPLPAGLINHGNTCYVNSTLQALRTITDFSQPIQDFTGDQVVLTKMGDVFKNLKPGTTGDDGALQQFLLAMRREFTQFDEIEQSTGQYKQQDAEELWTELIYAARAAGLTNSNSQNVIEHFLEGRFEVERRRADQPDSTPERSVETFDKLSCHITVSTNFLRDGLMAGLKEEISLMDEQLGHNVTYTVQRKISRLPKYLVVQFVRFYWRRDTWMKAKILRKVNFPFQLDVSDMCTDELKSRIIPAREQYREMESAFEEAKRAAKRAAMSSLAKKLDKVEDQLPLEKQKELRAAVEAKIDPEVAADVGANPYGIYDLAAVVTHQGQTADSGHYQAWTRNFAVPGQWWRFNDDKVTIVDDAKIEQLCGGGESDAALILVYRTADV